MRVISCFSVQLTKSVFQLFLSLITLETSINWYIIHFPTILFLLTSMLLTWMATKLFFTLKLVTIWDCVNECSLFLVRKQLVSSVYYLKIKTETKENCMMIIQFEWSKGQVFLLKLSQPLFNCYCAYVLICCWHYKIANDPTTFFRST